MNKCLLCLLLAVLCVCLASCHGAREVKTFEIPSAFNENKAYEITFWAKNDTNKTQTAVYEKAIRDFEALYPNITVKMRLYTDYGKIYNDVITNIATATTPNVCITYPDHIAAYLEGENVVVPLDALMDDENYGLGGKALRFDSPKKNEIIPEYLSEGRVLGAQYALPFMRSTEALYINETMLQKLGFTLPDVVTWDFVWAAAEKAAEKDENGLYKVNGGKTMIPFIYKSTDNMMIQMLAQLDAPYSTPSGDVLIFSGVTKDLLYTVSSHAASGAFSTFKISGYPANKLNAGECLFAVDSTAGSSWMGKAAPHSDIDASRIVDFETAVRPVPQFDPAHPKMISQGPSVCIFGKDDSGEVLASWLFAQFLLTDGVQIAYASTEGYVPVTTGARESAVYRDYLRGAGSDNDEHYAVKIAATEMLLDSAADTFVTPVFNGSASLRDAAGALIESTVKSTVRKETVDDAYMEKLFHDTRTLYRLDSIESTKGEKADLGPLPVGAKALLSGIALVWVLLGAGELKTLLRKKTQKNGKKA